MKVALAVSQVGEKFQFAVDGTSVFLLGSVMQSKTEKFGQENCFSFSRNLSIFQTYDNKLKFRSELTCPITSLSILDGLSRMLRAVVQHLILSIRFRL